MAKLTVDLDRAQLKQLMRLSIRTHKPLWMLLAEIVQDGLQRRQRVRRKVLRRRVA